MIAQTPEPPYYAVVFTSTRTNVDDGYGDTAQRMVELAKDVEGYLGIESARDPNLGITVSYWSSLEAIGKWKAHSEHVIAQERGRESWYNSYTTRICKVERAYSFDKK